MGVKHLSILFGCLIGLQAAAAPALAQTISGKVEVHFIDVGQADSVLVLSPKKDCVMLIDSADTRYPGSSKSFKAYMQERLPKGHPINLVVASHPHSDHIGSMKWVLQNYAVQTFIDNGQEYPRKTEKGNPTLFGKLKDEIGRQVSSGSLKYFPDTKAPRTDQDFCPGTNLNTSMIFPKKGYPSKLCADNANDCSVIVKMTYNKTSFLFSGDAEKEQEQLVLDDEAARGNLAATVLKVGHHGSDTSSTKPFIQAISPKWIVVSAGKKGVGTNLKYNHPRRSTITTLLGAVGKQGVNQRLIDVYDADKSKWGKQVISGGMYVTSRDGSVVLSSDGSDIRRE
jgi:competence protein ComEC